MVDRVVASALGRRSLLVLVYHGVRPDEAHSLSVNWGGKHVSRSAFEEQIDWLANAGYRFLGEDELRWSVKRRRLPHGPAALVTFDDGYSNNHTVALPILRDRSAPAIVFLVGNFIASREPLWVDQLEQAFAHTRSGEISISCGPQASRFSLGSLTERQLAEASVRARYKQLSPRNRERALGELFSQLSPPTSLMPSLYDPLSWSQVEELRQEGWQIGSHTMTHTILSGLKVQLAEQEVRDGRDLIEERLGEPCDLFAYPNGLRGDFTPETERVLRQLGITCAFTGVEGRVNAGFDPFEIRRIGVNDRMTLREFKLRTTGVIGLAKTGFAGLRRARTAVSSLGTNKPQGRLGLRRR